MRKSLLFKAALALLVACLFIPAAYAFTGQTVVANVAFSAQFSETVSSGLPTPLQASQSVSQSANYTVSGTAAGQLDTCYAAQVTLVASTPQSFDLTALTDPLGKTSDFARVREFVIQNVTTTAGYDVKVSASASNGWPVLPTSAQANVLYARAGGVVYISDKLSSGSGIGNVVGASTKSFTLDPGTNGPITVNIWIVGCSAQ